MDLKFYLWWMIKLFEIGTCYNNQVGKHTFTPSMQLEMNTVIPLYTRIQILQDKILIFFKAAVHCLE